MKWISIDSGRFPSDNEEILCWNGEKVVSAIYRCNDMATTNAGFEFEVQKNHTEGDRSMIAYWVGITHWMPLPSPPNENPG
jgi:hypothetical protein